jgi:hypothetical protein
MYRILAIKGTITFDTKSGKDLNLVYYFLNNQRRYVHINCRRFRQY